MSLRSHISVLKEYKGSYGAYYMQDLSIFFIMNVGSFKAKTSYTLDLQFSKD